jgi:hypothetical protein
MLWKQDLDESERSFYDSGFQKMKLETIENAVHSCLISSNLGLAKHFLSRVDSSLDFSLDLQKMQIAFLETADIQTAFHSIVSRETFNLN